MYKDVRVSMLTLLALVSAASSHGEQTVKDLLARLAKEAAAFQRVAPQVTAMETLHQRVVSAPARHGVRIGAAPAEVKWRERELISEYGFAAIGPERSTHEIRQVILSGGKKVQEQAKAQEALARLIVSNDDQRKMAALRQMQRYGLRGGATDLGPLLLLFEQSQQERYEFLLQEHRTKDGALVQVFRYKQLDGPEAVTVFEGKSAAAKKLRVQGEIWVRSSDGLPLRITLAVSAGAESGGAEPREEASVDYSMSEFGALLPARIEHREFHGVDLVAENVFTYSNYKKLRYSSDLRF